MLTANATVLDGTNGDAPIQGATVSVYDSGNTLLGSGTTDSNGQCSVEVTGTHPLKVVFAGTTQGAGASAFGVSWTEGDTADFYVSLEGE